MVKPIIIASSVAVQLPRQAPVGRRTAAAAPAAKVTKLTADNAGEMGGARFNVADQSGQDLWHSSAAPVSMGMQGLTVGNGEQASLSGNRGGLASAFHLGAADAPFVDIFANFGAIGANLRGHLPGLDVFGSAAAASLAGAFGPTFAVLAPGVSWATANGARMRLGGAGFLDAQSKISLSQPAAVAHDPGAQVAIRWHERQAPGFAADLAGGLGMGSIGMGGVGGKLVGAKWQETTWQTHLPAATAARLLASPAPEQGLASFLPGWAIKQLPGQASSARPGRLPDAANPFAAGPGHRELAVGDSLEVVQGQRVAGGIMPGIMGLRVSGMGSVASERHLHIHRLDADHLHLRIDNLSSQGAQLGADALLLGSSHVGANWGEGSTAELVVSRRNPAAMALYVQAVGGDKPALEALLDLPQVGGSRAATARQGSEQEISTLMPLLMLARSGLSPLGQRWEGHTEQLKQDDGSIGQRQSVTLARHRLRAGSHTLEVSLSAPPAGAGPATLSIRANLSRASQAAVAEWARLWAPAPAAHLTASAAAPTRTAPLGPQSLQVHVAVAGEAQQAAVQALLSQPRLNVDTLMAALAEHTAGTPPTVIIEHGELVAAQAEAARLLLRPGALSPAARAKAALRLGNALAAWQQNPLVAAHDHRAHRSTAAAAQAALALLNPQPTRA